MKQSRNNHSQHQLRLPYLPNASEPEQGCSWYKMRSVIFVRDNGVCQICGTELEWEFYECSHIVDRCAGGSDLPSNLVAGCNVCNRWKPIHESRSEYVEWLLDGAAIGEMEAIIRNALSRQKVDPSELLSFIRGGTL